MDNPNDPCSIPRSQIDALMTRHGAQWPAQGDAACSVVREAVAVIRKEAAGISLAKFEEAIRHPQLTKLADELTALVDQYEQKECLR